MSTGMRARWISWIALCWLWVLTLPAYGQELITKEFYPDTSFKAIAEQTAITSDGSLIVFGQSRYPRPTAGVWCINSTGDFKWAREIYLPTSVLNIGTVTIAPDGSILLSLSGTKGTQADRVYLISLSADGVVRWSNSYSVRNGLTCSSHCSTSDNGALIVGRYITPTISGAIIWKVTAQGAVEWSRQFTSEKRYCESFLVSEEGDGSIMMVAGFRASGTLLSMIHLSANGSLQQVFTYGTDSDFVKPGSLQRCANGDLIFSGLIFATNSDNNSVLVRCKSTGEWRWLSTYSYFGTSEALGSVYEESNGDLLVMSINLNQQSPHILRTNSIGIAQQTVSLPDRSHQYYYTQLAAISSSLGKYGVISTLENGDAIYYNMVTLTPMLEGCGLTPTLISQQPLDIVPASIILETQDNQILTETAAIKLEEISATSNLFCRTTPASVSAEAANALVSVYPNPVQNSATLTIILPANIYNSGEILLRDMSSRIVYRQKIEKASTTVEIPTAGLSSGIYSIEFIDASSFTAIWRAKVVVE